MGADRSQITYIPYESLRLKKGFQDKCEVRFLGVVCVVPCRLALIMGVCWVLYI